jgi:colicin import membrane protein
MSRSIQAGACPLPSTPTSENRARAIAFSVSALVHLLFFLLMVFSPSWTRQRQLLPPAISVTMVSMPGAGNVLRPPKQPPPSAPPKKGSAPAPETTKAAPETPKPPPKESKNPLPTPPKEVVPLEAKAKPAPKPVPPDPKQEIQKALQQLRQKAGAERPNAVTSAIARLKGQVDKEPPRPLSGPDASDTPSGIGLSGSGYGALGGSPDGTLRSLEPIDVYRLEVAHQIQNNWAFADQLAGSLRPDLSALVAFNVLPSGEIRDVWFDQRSGNTYLDESAMRAVIKSSPVTPHPPGIRQSAVTVGLRFTPKGIQ